MKGRYYSMTEETKMILEQLEKMDDKITDIQLTLENETNRNIKLIAEGHLDLSRKLDEALKVENEKENPGGFGLLGFSIL